MEDRYYIKDKQQRVVGPLSLTAMRDLWGNGLIGNDTPVKREGTDIWAVILDFQEIKPASKSTWQTKSTGKAFNDRVNSMRPSQGLPAQNIFQMYVANGNKAGFYVRRDSWSTIYARVVTIDGRTEGPLRGRPPYYGDPTVTMDVFYNDGSRQKSNQMLSCPGTYTYTRLERVTD